MYSICTWTVQDSRVLKRAITEQYKTEIGFINISFVNIAPSLRTIVHEATNWLAA